MMATEYASAYRLQAKVAQLHDIADCDRALGKGDCPMCLAFELAKRGGRVPAPRRPDEFEEE